jgi:hypothetical protein
MTHAFLSALRVLEGAGDGRLGGADGRSLVAGVNAMFRAAESRRREGRILDDPFAARFAERDARVRAIRAARGFVPGLARLLEELQTAHCIRHRAIDALCLAAAADGYRQVVIAGASPRRHPGCAGSKPIIPPPRRASGAASRGWRG